MASRGAGRSGGTKRRREGNGRESAKEDKLLWVYDEFVRACACAEGGGVVGSRAASKLVRRRFWELDTAAVTGLREKGRR